MYDRCGALHFVPMGVHLVYVGFWAYITLGYTTMLWALSTLYTFLHDICLIAHLHLLVWATNERFLLAWATFRDGLARESHWLQPMLVLTIHWWPTPVSRGGL